MTQQEIQERNKQIALMLDWVESNLSGIWYKKDDTAINVVYSEHTNYPHRGLPFHRDWNWLMEAVEFIEKLQSDNFYMEFFWLNGPNVSLYQKHKQKGLILWETHGRFKNVETKKEAVFIAVSDFAKLYNEKKI